MIPVHGILQSVMHVGEILLRYLSTVSVCYNYRQYIWGYGMSPLFIPAICKKFYPSQEHNAITLEPQSIYQLLHPPLTKIYDSVYELFPDISWKIFRCSTYFQYYSRWYCFKKTLQGTRKLGLQVDIP